MDAGLSHINNCTFYIDWSKNHPEERQGSLCNTIIQTLSNEAVIRPDKEPVIYMYNKCSSSEISIKPVPAHTPWPHH